MFGLVNIDANEAHQPSGNFAAQLSTASQTLSQAFGQTFGQTLSGV